MECNLGMLPVVVTIILFTHHQGDVILRQDRRITFTQRLVEV